MPLYSKCIRTLTFENVCYALQKEKAAKTELDKKIDGTKRFADDVIAKMI